MAMPSEASARPIRLVSVSRFYYLVATLSYVTAMNKSEFDTRPRRILMHDPHGRPGQDVRVGAGTFAPNEGSSVAELDKLYRINVPRRVDPGVSRLCCACQVHPCRKGVDPRSQS
jgi:hypothetical protein